MQSEKEKEKKKKTQKKTKKRSTTKPSYRCLQGRSSSRPSRNCQNDNGKTPRMNRHVDIPTVMSIDNVRAFSEASLEL